MSDSGFMDVTEKIICVTPSTERRHLERRASDRSDRDKARRFDQLMVDALFQMEHWVKTWNAYLGAGNSPHSNFAGFCEGLIHANRATLAFYGGHVKPCPCGACNIGEKEVCVKTGGGE